MTGPNAQVADILAWLRTHALGTASRGDLRLDSRQIEPGDVFVGLPGVTPDADDGRRYLQRARERGAVAAVVEAAGFSAADFGLPVLPVRNLRRVLGQLAARYYGLPSESMQVIGITGTNGKTSTAFWTAQMLDAAGKHCAVLGTVGSGFPGEALAEALLTTPDAAALQRELLRLRTAGARAVAMEVSSIGLDQGRVHGTRFDVAVFTNLTRDHLDYHRTMQAYEAAKAALFDWPTLTAAVLNLDDPAGRRLLARLAERAHAGAVRVTGYTTYAGQTDAGSVSVLAHVLSARDIRVEAGGIAFTLLCGRAEQRIEAPLVGSFNVANLLAAIGAALAAGVDLDVACRAVPHLQAPPGRMQQVRTRREPEPLAVVDYAHTADAIEQALLALRPLAQARGGKLWIVFGAGGDRDAGKRAPMGAAAGQYADRVVITSDNPRREDPATVIAEVAAGVGVRMNVDLVIDRAEAVRRALAAADVRDVVLIAGKGHESTQDIAGVKRRFSDVEAAQAALNARAGVTC